MTSMTNQHPITPPPELVRQWASEWMQSQNVHRDNFMATRAAQWGADQQLKLDAEQIEKAYQAGAGQELEACCEYLVRCAQWEPEDVTELRATRRPKPPSLKERALHELADVYNRDEIDDSTYDTIRFALEALPDD
jgi:hypothetical protein